jgi:hypothetical protein
MSRKAVVWTLAGYFAVALTLACFIEVNKPFASLNTRTVGSAVGGALGLFVISGLVPLIIWAAQRFRARKASFPLFLWAALGLIIGALAVRGNL